MTHPRLHSVNEIFLRNTQPDAFPASIPGQGGRRGIRGYGRRIIDRLLHQRCRVPGVMPGDRVQRQGYVWNVPGQYPDLVQGRCKGHQPITAYQAVGGLQSHHPAQGGRLPDASAGVGAQGVNCFRSGNRRRRSAAAAAGHPGEVPGVMGRKERRVLCGRSHRELVHVALAQHDCAMLEQLLRGGGIVYGHVVLQHPGTTGGRDALGGNDVLYLHRDTRQGRAVAGGNALVGLYRLFQRDV